MTIQVVITDRIGNEITEFTGDQLIQLEEDSKLFIKTLPRESGPYNIKFIDEDGNVFKERRITGGRFTSTARALERLQNVRLGKPDPTGPGIVDINPVTQEELAEIQELLDTEPRAMRGIARDDPEKFIQRKRDIESKEQRKMTMREFFDRNL